MEVLVVLSIGWIMADAGLAESKHPAAHTDNSTLGMREHRIFWFLVVKVTRIVFGPVWASLMTRY